MRLLPSFPHLPSETVRCGQEHDLFHDTAPERYFKVTCNGVFGLRPGIELALVSGAHPSLLADRALWRFTELRMKYLS